MTEEDHEATEYPTPVRSRRKKARFRGPKAFLPVGPILNGSLLIYLKNFIPFSLIGFLVLSPLYILKFYLEGMHVVVDFILSLVLTQILTASLIYGVFRKLKNQSAHMGKCLSVGLSRFIPLVGLVLVIAIYCSAASILPVFLAGFIGAAGGTEVAMIALAVAMIPAAMIYMALYAAAPVLVVEGKGLKESMNRSMNLTRGNRFRIFTVFLTIHLIRFLVLIGLGMVLYVGAEDEAFRIGSTTLLIIDYITVVFFSSFSGVASCLVYYNLKVQIEGVDESELASVFD